MSNINIHPEIRGAKISARVNEVEDDVVLRLEVGSLDCHIYLDEQQADEISIKLSEILQEKRLNEVDNRVIEQLA